MRTFYISAEMMLSSGTVFSIPYNIIAPKIGTFYFYCCHCLSYYFFCYLIMYSENFHLNYDITQNSAVQKKTITKNLLDAQKKSR